MKLFTGLARGAKGFRLFIVDFRLAYWALTHSHTHTYSTTRHKLAFLMGWLAPEQPWRNCLWARVPARRGLLRVEGFVTPPRSLSILVCVSA